MDAKLLKAITDLTAAIDRNTKQIERSDPNSPINRMNSKMRLAFEGSFQTEKPDQAAD
ncbi:hypothetical protein ACPA1J_23030 [Stutzerimonas stutzeri]|jgi:hypothetical protein|uniref:hypothetical protein n=1 Tax=Stutzerimonas stutzeri TaxID=316 RepID=UPI003C30BE95